MILTLGGFRTGLGFGSDLGGGGGNFSSSCKNGCILSFLFIIAIFQPPLEFKLVALTNIVETVCLFWNGDFGLQKRVYAVTFTRNSSHSSISFQVGAFQVQVRNIPKRCVICRF
jgi:hypothetical protein